MASFCGKVFTEGCDEFGSERDGCLVFEQEREALAEFDDKAGPERAREVDFDKADVDAGEATGCSGA